MNEKEHLLVILMEESVEVAKETSKALRFGEDEVMPGQLLTNRERILHELNDLWAIVEMLGLQQVDRAAIERKKEKIAKYMEYAKNACETLTPNA
jgi:hypothetical protein